MIRSNEGYIYVSEEGKAVKRKSVRFCKDVHVVQQGLVKGESGVKGD